jgi:hypothetical protein
MRTENKACWYDMWAASVPFTKLMREHFHLWISARGFCEGLKIVIANKYLAVIFPGMIKLEQVWYIKILEVQYLCSTEQPESQESCKSCFSTVALQQPQPYLDKLNLLQTRNVGLWWAQPNLAKKPQSALNAYWWTQKHNLPKPNVDLDFVSKYIPVNQLSIWGVYGLFLERIYQTIYIA